MRFRPERVMAVFSNLHVREGIYGTVGTTLRRDGFS